MKILVVTEDRALQRQLSHFFDMMGYEVLQAADTQMALAAVEAESPHVVLIGSELGARADLTRCGLLSDGQSAGGLFKFLVVEEPDENLIQEALEEGIDDFLHKPIDYGELLSRLRVAARVLEFDRRVAQQGQVDPLTGLVSRSAFVSQLRSQWMEQAGTSRRAACIVGDIDFSSRIGRLHGAAAREALLLAVTQELNHLRVGSEVLGCLGADRFCAMLPGASDTAAAEWAEHVRQALATAKFKVQGTTWQITASFGVAGCDAADSAEQLLNLATQALESAKASGRNCVVRYGEFGADARELIAPAKLFDGTVARGVMTPCTVFLQSDEPVGQAVSLLHQTRLDAIAVVDAEGKLLGLCEQGQVITVDESQYSTQRVRDVMTTDVQRFGEQEEFATLLDFFTRDERSLAVVVDAERPVGLITCNSLLAMSKPVTTGSLAPESQYSDTSEYLMVPDLRPLETEPADCGAPA